MQSKWWLRGVTAGAWALVAACAVFWALRMGSSAPAASSAPVARTQGASGGADQARLASLLGAAAPAAVPGVAAAPVSAGSRFAVSGVVVQDAMRRKGLAVIAVDGKPARIYRVGDRVEEGYVLQSVAARSVVLATDMQASGGLQLALPAAAGNANAGARAGQPPEPPRAPLPQITLGPQPLQPPAASR